MILFALIWLKNTHSVVMLLSYRRVVESKKGGGNLMANGKRKDATLVHGIHHFLQYYIPVTKWDDLSLEL